MFLWLTFVAAWIRTPNLSHARWMLKPNAPLTGLQSTEGRVLMIDCCCFFCSVQEYFTQFDVGKSSYHQAKESQVSFSIYIVFDKRLGYHFLLDAQQLSWNYLLACLNRFLPRLLMLVTKHLEPLHIGQWIGGVAKGLSKQWFAKMEILHLFVCL